MTPVTQPSTTLEFHLVDDRNGSFQAQQSGKVPSGDKVYELRDGGAILRRDAFVTNDEIAEVTANTRQQDPTVYVRLDARGAASMLRTTRENRGHRVVVVYNGRVINDAVIRGAIGAEFELSDLTVEEARALVMQFHQATKK